MTKMQYDFGGLLLKPTLGGHLDMLCVELKEEFPKLRLQHKSAHWYWRVLHWILLIVTFGSQRKFNSTMSTTLKNTIGLSDKRYSSIVNKGIGWEDRLWSLLMHEREHLRQIAKYGIVLFLLLYIFVYTPFGLAYFRAKFERAGYTQTLRCWYVLDSRWAMSEDAIDWLVSHFTSSTYGFMWVFPQTVRKWFTSEIQMLIDAGRIPR